MQFLKKNIAFNLLFWVLYFLYEWLANASVNNEYKRYLINAAVIVPIDIAATWVTMILIRRYYAKGKRLVFWAGFISSLLFFVFTKRAFNYYYTYPKYWPGTHETMSFFFFPKLLFEGVSIYLIVALYGMFYFIRAWYEQQQKAQALQKDKVEAQLELLKSQVQPHFIFNTLNNIYSLSEQHDGRTSELIYRLSALLSYMLYDSKEYTIPLKKEIEYINNYIELEKIRYGDRLDVSVNIFDQVDQFRISPLLLLPLIENSFKHGVSNNIEDSWIRMDVSVREEWLSVKIENSYCKGSMKNGTNNGIGLQNVKKRLEILYPSRHEFRYIREGQSFLTILKIKDLDYESTMLNY